MNHRSVISHYDNTRQNLPRSTVGFCFYGIAQIVKSVYNGYKCHIISIGCLRDINSQIALWKYYKDKRPLRHSSHIWSTRQNVCYMNDTFAHKHINIHKASTQHSMYYFFSIRTRINISSFVTNQHINRSLSYKKLRDEPCQDDRLKTQLKGERGANPFHGNMSDMRGI